MAGFGIWLGAPASSYFSVGRGRQPVSIESSTTRLDVSLTRMTALYYRLLSTPSHHAHFISGARNSTHASPPGEWIEEWAESHSSDPERYPLGSFGGPYSAAARAAFILAAPRYAPGELWSEADRTASAELDGLCVFTSCEAARQYSNGWEGERFLVLAGIMNGRCAEDESVLLKNWVLVDGPLTLHEFDSRYPRSAT